MSAGLWIVLVLPGCAFSLESKGDSPSPDGVEKIIAGQSTKDDVLALLGSPDKVIYSNREHDPLFERAFSYRLDIQRRTVFFILIFGTYRSDSKADHVMIFFDENNVVEHVASRYDADKARYGLPTE